MQERKYKTPRGAAATAAKNKNRDKNYDRAELALPKGIKAQIKEVAQRQGKSFNAYVWEAVRDKVQQDAGVELEWIKKEGL